MEEITHIRQTKVIYDEYGEMRLTYFLTIEYDTIDVLFQSKT